MTAQTTRRAHFVTVREARELRDMLAARGLRYTASELRRYVANIESDLRAQGEHDAARAVLAMFQAND